MLEPWQNFQADFGKYLRDPQNEILPEGVIPRRSKVYEDLLFNNLCGFLNTCFPVSKSILEPKTWTSLSRSFFRDWRCHSPRFNDIPKEFLDYLVSDISPELKYPWLMQLAHYEWVELAVDTFDESSLTKAFSKEENATSGITVNSSLHNLIYDWPVHQISPDNLPAETKQTFLLVFRTSDNEVSFTEVNAATSALIHLFEQGHVNSEQALADLASQMDVSFNQEFKAFGLDMISQLNHQEVLIEV